MKLTIYFLLMKNSLMLQHLNYSSQSIPFRIAFSDLYTCWFHEVVLIIIISIYNTKQNQNVKNKMHVFNRYKLKHYAKIDSHAFLWNFKTFFSPPESIYRYIVVNNRLLERS